MAVGARAAGGGKGRGRGRILFRKPDPDIIPIEFFADLHGAVDSLLHEEVQKVVASRMPISLVPKRGPAKRPSKSAARASVRVSMEEPADTQRRLQDEQLEIGFNKALFPQSAAALINPTPWSTAPKQTTPWSSAAAPRQASDRDPFLQAPQSEIAQTLPYSQQAQGFSEETLRPGDTAQTHPIAETQEAAHKRFSDHMAAAASAVTGPPPVSSPRTIASSQVAVRREDTTSASPRSRAEAAAKNGPGRAKTYHETLHETSLDHGVEEDERMALVAHLTQRPTPPEVQISGEQQILPTRHVFQYNFCSSSRFHPVTSENFNEAVERLRQYLVMQFGSYNKAFEKLETSGDMTGIQGCGHGAEYEGFHREGMLRYREFMVAVTHLIPNWAEVTGVGKLRKLFQAIDYNGSGYINFQELMGVPVHHDLASLTYHRKYSAYDCMFRSRANQPWNISQMRTNSCTETFQASMRYRNMDRLMLNLAPLFTPIHEMEIHHHEQDDGGSSMASESHSSEQELSLEHIMLRVRAAGWKQQLNWRKTFVYYDHRHTGEITWHEFRSSIRKDAQISHFVLTERDLKELFYNEEVLDDGRACTIMGDDHEATDSRHHCILYANLLKWLEPEPTEEEKAELKREEDDVRRHAKTRHFHKTDFLRKLEVERRHVAADHHSHMSCWPCTKLCPICNSVILVSSWATHKHSCTEKVRMAKEREEAMDEEIKNSFKPWISARSLKVTSSFKQAKHRNAQEKSGLQVRQARFPIRARIKAEREQEQHEKQHAELKFHPQLNERSRHIHRMVHQDAQDTGLRLMNARPQHKIPENERKPQPQPVTPQVEKFTPQITVRGVQKGFDRAGCSIFHRLHHGPPETALFVDPGQDIDDDQLVHHQTKHVMRVKKPMGIGHNSWEKAKHEQQCNYEDMMNDKKDTASPSLASTGFPEDEAGPQSSPDGSSTYTPNQFSIRGDTPNQMSWPGPVKSTPGGASSGKQTPNEGGGVRALTGKIRASFTGDQTGLPFGSPRATSPQAGGQTPVLIGTPKVMGLLTRCHQAVVVSAKAKPFRDAAKGASEW